VSAVAFGEHSTAEGLGGVCSCRNLSLNTAVTQGGIVWRGGENARGCLQALQCAVVGEGLPWQLPRVCAVGSTAVWHQMCTGRLSNTAGWYGVRVLVGTCVYGAAQQHSLCASLLVWHVAVVRGMLLWLTACWFCECVLCNFASVC